MHRDTDFTDIGIVLCLHNRGIHVMISSMGLEMKFIMRNPSIRMREDLDVGT